MAESLQILNCAELEQVNGGGTLLAIATGLVTVAIAVVAVVAAPDPISKVYVAEKVLEVGAGIVATVAAYKA